MYLICQAICKQVICKEIGLCWMESDGRWQNEYMISSAAWERSTQWQLQPSISTTTNSSFCLSLNHPRHTSAGINCPTIRHSADTQSFPCLRILIARWGVLIEVKGFFAQPSVSLRLWAIGSDWNLPVGGGNERCLLPGGASDGRVQRPRLRCEDGRWAPFESVTPSPWNLSSTTQILIKRNKLQQDGWVTMITRLRLQTNPANHLLSQHKVTWNWGGNCTESVLSVFPAASVDFCKDWTDSTHFSFLPLYLSKFWRLDLPRFAPPISMYRFRSRHPLLSQRGSVRGLFQEARHNETSDTDIFCCGVVSESKWLIQSTKWRHNIWFGTFVREAACM